MSTESIWLYSVVSIVGVSLISFVGLFTLSISTKTLSKILLLLVGFSTGALFGDAFLHLLPEAVEEGGFTLNISLAVLLGIIVSFVIEKVIRWRHYHYHEDISAIRPFAWMNLYGDAMHNFIDGVIIAGSYMVSAPLGISTTLAVIFHEIPQEVGDFGVLLKGGFSKKQALLFNFGSALFALLGALLTLAIGNVMQQTAVFLVPFAAGNFIYIAGSDLIPELDKEKKVGKSFYELMMLLSGIGVMILLLTYE